MEEVVPLLYLYKRSIDRIIRLAFLNILSFSTFLEDLEMSKSHKLSCIHLNSDCFI